MYENTFDDTFEGDVREAAHAKVDDLAAALTSTLKGLDVTEATLTVSLQVGGFRTQASGTREVRWSVWRDEATQREFSDVDDEDGGA